MKEEKRIKQLIKIILGLFLTFAFFSSSRVQGDSHLILLVFLFGIFSIVLLYLGMSLSNNFFKQFFKIFGYLFAGSFILIFNYFLFDTLALVQEVNLFEELLLLLNKKTFLFALLIPLITLISYILLEKVIRNKY